MRKLTALLVVALLASSASAALSLQVVDEGLLGVTDGGGNELAYVTLAIASDAGGTPNAYDGGFYGPLHQAHGNWGRDPVVTPTTEEFYPGDPIELDSHFTFESADILPQTAPDEDVAASYYASGAYFDLGYDTYLTGIFTDPNASGSVWEFAYLVGAASTTVDVIGETASPEGEYAALEQGYTFVPEPATMSLLALGGVAALIRRKR